jgi:DNA polymerase IV
MQTRLRSAGATANVCSVPAKATILHADIDSFFASVEQQDDPSLRGRPVIVGGGVVLAASYEAKAHGVHSAMGGARARRLCPQAVVVEPHWDAYVEASKAVLALFRETAPLVEALSIDEAFLDVRGLERISGTPREIAERLRREVREQVGLPVTVGVARTKHLAKVASAVAKPDGLLVVEPDQEIAFLHPLPVERLWGVGEVTARKLNAHGLETVGQVAALSEAELVEMLGRASGRQVHALAHNRDPRRVRTARRRRSIGSQRAFGRIATTPESLDTMVVAIADRLGRRLRAKDFLCRTVVLRLRFRDYTRATRSQTMIEATNRTDAILATARGLLRAALPKIERDGVTLVGLSLTNLEEDDGVQLALPIDGHRAHALDTTIDDLRDRFGTDAITRAVLLGRKETLQTWLQPDDAESGHTDSH